jgi:hypothetical protein
MQRSESVAEAPATLFDKGGKNGVLGRCVDLNTSAARKIKRKIKS